MSTSLRCWRACARPLVSDRRPAMPEPLIDPDCRDGKCGSCVGGPCEHDCHTPRWMLEEAGIAAPESTPQDDTTAPVTAEGRNRVSTDTTPTAEGSYEWYRGEVERLNERIEYLNGRIADLQQYEVGIKHLTTEDGAINMSLGLAHDQMRIFVAAFQKVLDEQGGPNYVEMNFKLAGTLDRYTVTIKRPKGKTPADVASEQRVRPEKAGAEAEQLRYERRLLGAARMVLDAVAAGQPELQEPARREA